MTADGPGLLSLALRVIAFHLPLLLVAAAGTAVALRYRVRHPQMAVLAIAGFAAIAAGQLVAVWLLAVVSPTIPPDFAGPEAAARLATWNLAGYLMWLLALVLLLGAVYADRDA